MDGTRKRRPRIGGVDSISTLATSYFDHELTFLGLCRRSSIRLFGLAGSQQNGPKTLEKVEGTSLRGFREHRFELICSGRGTSAVGQRSLIHDRLSSRAFRCTPYATSWIPYPSDCVHASSLARSWPVGQARHGKEF